MNLESVDKSFASLQPFHSHLVLCLGGVYGGASVIKSRLLPWLGQGLLTGFPSDHALTLVAESAAKDREINEIQDMYERSINNLEGDLADTKNEATELRSE